jgi:hypothetical protein
VGKTANAAQASVEQLKAADPVPEELLDPDELVLVNFKVTRRTRLALKQLSELTGLSIKRLMQRGIQQVLEQPTLGSFATEGEAPSVGRLEAEEAAIEMKARLQLKEAQAALRRVQAWRQAREESRAGRARVTIRPSEALTTTNK